MSFQEKNFTVSLVNFTLILGFYSVRMAQLIQGGNFTPEHVFRAWWVVVIFAVLVTILTTVLTHVMIAFVDAVCTDGESGIADVQDERDERIDLKGTRVTYAVSALGSFFAVLTFVFGQPALMMFTLMIFFGILAQVVGDLSRLYLCRRGF